MEIKIKKRGLLKDYRLEGHAGIDDLIVKEDLISPEKERVLIFFKGKRASGILIFSKREIERLNNTLKSRLGLVKRVRKIR